MTQTRNSESSAELTQRVAALIAEQLNIPLDRVIASSTLESLGADSLDRVELVMKFEEEFSLEINDDDAEKLVTIADLVAYIESRQS